MLHFYRLGYDLGTGLGAGKEVASGRCLGDRVSSLSVQISLGEGLITAGAQLVELDLSDNAFGPDGVRGFEALLKSPACFTLQELKLNNCGMGIGGGKVGCQPWAVPSCTHIELCILALRTTFRGRGCCLSLQRRKAKPQRKQPAASEERSPGYVAKQPFQVLELPWQHRQ